MTTPGRLHGRRNGHRGRPAPPAAERAPCRPAPPAAERAPAYRADAAAHERVVDDHRRTQVVLIDTFTNNGVQHASVVGRRHGLPPRRGGHVRGRQLRAAGRRRRLRHVPVRRSVLHALLRRRRSRRRSGSRRSAHGGSGRRRGGGLVFGAAPAPSGALAAGPYDGAMLRMLTAGESHGKGAGRDRGGPPGRRADRSQGDRRGAREAAAMATGAAAASGSRRTGSRS